MLGDGGASFSFKQSGPIEKVLLRGGLNPSASSIAAGFPLTGNLSQPPRVVRALITG